MVFIHDYFLGGAVAGAAGACSAGSPPRNGLLTCGVGACSGDGALCGPPGWAVPAGGWPAGGWFRVVGSSASTFSRSTTEEAPFSAGQDGQQQADDEKQRAQGPGDPGHQVARAAHRHHARRAAAADESTAFGPLQQDGSDQQQADENLGGEQEA